MANKYDNNDLRIRRLRPQDDDIISDIVTLTESGARKWNAQQLGEFTAQKDHYFLLALTPDKELIGFIACKGATDGKHLQVEDMQIDTRMGDTAYKRSIQSRKGDEPIKYDSKSKFNLPADHLIMHALMQRPEGSLQCYEKLDFSKITDQKILHSLERWGTIDEFILPAGTTAKPQPKNEGTLHFTFLDPDDRAMLDSISMLSEHSGHSGLVHSSSGWRQIAQQHHNKVLVALAEDDRTVGYLHYLMDNDGYHIQGAHIGALFNDVVFDKSSHRIEGRKEPVVVTPPNPQDAAFHMGMQLKMLAGSTRIDSSEIKQDTMLAGLVNTLSGTDRIGQEDKPHPDRWRSRRDDRAYDRSTAPWPPTGSVNPSLPPSSPTPPLPEPPLPPKAFSSELPAAVPDPANTKGGDNLLAARRKLIAATGVDWTIMRWRLGGYLEPVSDKLRGEEAVQEKIFFCTTSPLKNKEGAESALKNAMRTGYFNVHINESEQEKFAGRAILPALYTGNILKADMGPRTLASRFEVADIVPSADDIRGWPGKGGPSGRRF